MKSPIRALVVALGVICAAGAFAQTAAPAATGTASKPATPAPTKKPAAAADTAASGAGNAKVWVNNKSKVYHCEGSKSYGTTKSGEYMTEAEAKAKGFHGVKGKSCSK